MMGRSEETAEGRTGLQMETSTLSPPTVHLQGNAVVTHCVLCVCEWAFSGKMNLERMPAMQ